MAAVNAVGGEVAELLAGVLHAGASLVGGVIARQHQALHDLGRDGSAAGERHALDLPHAREGHDAGHDGQTHAMAQALLTEPVEILVVKEELGDQVVGTCLLLEVERAEALLLRGGLDVALGVAGGADAQVGA